MRVSVGLNALKRCSGRRFRTALVGGRTGLERFGPDSRRSGRAVGAALLLTWRVGLRTSGRGSSFHEYLTWGFDVVNKGSHTCPYTSKPLREAGLVSATRFEDFGRQGLVGSRDLAASLSGGVVVGRHRGRPSPSRSVPGCRGTGYRWVPDARCGRRSAPGFGRPGERRAAIRPLGSRSALRESA